MLNYRFLTRKELPGAAQLVARSLANDPLYAKLVGKSFPNRAEYIQMMFRVYMIKLAIDIRKGFAVGVYDNDKLIGVASCIPYNSNIKIWDYLKDGVIRLLPYFKHGIFKLWVHSKKIRHVQKKLVESGTWYIHELAVNSKYRHKHVGRDLLLTQVLPELDRRHAKQVMVVTYTNDNRDFFERYQFKSIAHLSSKRAKNIVSGFNLLKTH